MVEMTHQIRNHTVELPVSPTLTSITALTTSSSLGITTQTPLLLNRGNFTHCLPLSNRTSLPLVLTAPEHLDELVLSHYRQYRVGDSIRLSCDISRELQGDAILTCITSKDGAHWDKIVPSCVEKKIALPPPPPRFNGTVFKSSVIGGVIAVVILLVFITFFLYRLREHQRRKRMARYYGEERERSSTTVTVMTDCAVAPSHDVPGNMLLTTFTTVAIKDDNIETTPKDVVIKNLTPRSSCMIPAPVYTATVHSSRKTSQGEKPGRITGPSSINVPCPVVPIQFAQGECSPPYYDTPNITSPKDESTLDLGIESSEDKYDEPTNVETDEEIMADFKFPNAKVTVKDDSEDEQKRYEIPEAQPVDALREDPTCYDKPQSGNAIREESTSYNIRKAQSGNAKSVVILRNHDTSPRYETVDDEMPPSPGYEIPSSDVPKRSLSCPEPPSPGYEIPDVGAINRPNSFEDVVSTSYDTPPKPVEVKNDTLAETPLETFKRTSINSKCSASDGIRSPSTVSLSSHYTDMSRQNSFLNEPSDGALVISNLPPPPAPETIDAIISESLEQENSIDEDTNYVLPDPSPHHSVISDRYDVPPSSRQNSTTLSTNGQPGADLSDRSDQSTEDNKYEPKNEYENVRRELFDVNDDYVNTRLPIENDKLPVTTV